MRISRLIPLAVGISAIGIPLALAPVAATEMLSGDDLTVEAKVNKPGNWLDFGENAVWTMVNNKLGRIDVADNSLVELDIGSSGDTRTIVATGGAVWVPDVALGKIIKVDPASRKVVLTFPAKMLYRQSRLAVDGGSVWVVTAGGGSEKTLTRFNATTGAIEAEISLPSIGGFVVAAFDSIWVSGVDGDAVYRIDPATNAIVDTIAVHARPKMMCADEASLWVLNTVDGVIDRIDGKTGGLAASIDAGLIVPRDGDLACGGGYVWGHLAAGTAGDKTIDAVAVAQIDPTTNTVLRKYIGGKGFGWDLRYGAGSLWITGSSVFRVVPPQ